MLIYLLVDGVVFYYNELSRLRLLQIEFVKVGRLWKLQLVNVNKPDSSLSINVLSFLRI